MTLIDQPRMEEPRRNGRRAGVIAALGVGALVGAAGYALLARRGEDFERFPDSAPGRTARRSRFGDYAVTGRTVTIDKPRAELFAFWRDFRNLPRFMANVRSVEAAGADTMRWTVEGPGGSPVELLTRIVEERDGELIAWRSVEGSAVDTEGRIAFRDAPAGRGTEVEAIVAYKPPGGELGRWIATLFQKDPSIQGRRELKRFKMLMETGEIATPQMKTSG